MRAAAILGLGSSTRDLIPFQHDPKISWSMGVPADSSQADVALIFGGDGTVHRHLGQLVKLGLPVLVVPCGSGNDFARALGLRRVRDSVSAWRKFCQEGKNTRTIDLGRITALSTADTRQSLPGPRYFCCVGGVGLDAEAARRAHAMPAWLRARGGYAIGLMGALVKFRAITMTLYVPDAESRLPNGTRSAMLLAFANTPVYGGGMKIAPRAQLDDGKLDFCLVNQVGKLRLSYLFPTVYFGRHLRIPEVEYFQSDRLRLETGAPLPVYADGEYVCHSPVEVSVAAKILQVIVQPSQTSF
ncbi:MAG TPA: diacylglycerol kinase family protein [Terriglobales bacterium]|nr:diacylglycerol kinase family protein [Terriglobales bacterium]